MNKAVMFVAMDLNDFSFTRITYHIFSLLSSGHFFSLL
jgi:hypothetical protein